MNEAIINVVRASEKQSVTFTNVSKQQIEQKNLGQDIPYIINITPSLTVTSDAGTGIGYTNFRIRGSDITRINVTVNGIPVNDPESHGVWFVDMPDFISNVENIQIQRGVGTSTNGTSAFGASISLQTANNSETPYSYISSSFGSFNTLKNTIGLGTGLINNHWSFDLRLSKLSSDGYIQRATSNLKSLYSSFCYYQKKFSVKAIAFSGLEKTYQAWMGVPEDSLTTNRRYNPYTYPNQTDNYQQDNYQLIFNKEFSKKTNANISLHYTYGRGYYEEYKEQQLLQDYNIMPVVMNTDTVNYSDIIRQKWLDNDFYGIVYSLSHSINKSKIIIGGAFNQYLGRHFNKVIWARYASNSEINHKYFDDKATKNDFNSFCKADILLTTKINLQFDLQYRYVYYKYNGYNYNYTISPEKAIFHFINPKIGLSYSLNNNSVLFSSYGISNKEPNRDDFIQSLPSNRPKSEKLNDIEIGFRHKSSNRSITLTLFNMNYKNQLILTGRINDVGAYIRENIPNSYRQGIELEYSKKFIKWIVVTGNIALSNNKIKNYTEYIDDYDTYTQKIIKYNKTDISFSPNLIVYEEIKLIPVNNLTITINNKYISKQYLDNTSSSSRMIKPYSVADLIVNYSLKLKNIKELSFSINLNNIFNTKYVSSGWTYSYFISNTRINDNWFYPQAGFNILSGITLKF